jgi:predicted component of type VI protein secretion system
VTAGGPANVRGASVWRDPQTVAFEVRLDDDEQVATLHRPAGGDELVLHRAGRSSVIQPGAAVRLVDGDEVAYGSQRLRIHLHEAGRPADEPPLEIEVRESPPDPAPIDEGPSGELIITVSDRQQGSQQFEFGPEVMIGSAQGNHLVLDGGDIEPRHARVVKPYSGNVCIVDLLTDGGTLVNGARIHGPTEVGDDDIITIGEFELRVHWRPAPR